MKRIAVLFLWMLIWLPLWAADGLGSRNLSMSDGLSANAVRNIVQDKFGFIWFGTDNGLCRYDGVRVQPYHIVEAGTSQYVSALLACDEGIYVGTERGIFRLPFGKGHFERLDMDIHSVVTSLAIDGNGMLWVSTMGQGVWQYELSSDKAEHYTLSASENAVAQVFVDNTHQVWAVTNWGKVSLYRLNRLHRGFEPIRLTYDGNTGSLRMLQTRDGRLWLGSWEDGLLLLHDDGRVERMLTGVGQHIHTLYERKDGCICIGCDEGVICFQPSSSEWHWLLGKQERNVRFVYALTNDREGGLWMGTYYGGVTYVSPVGRRFEGFTAADGLTGNVISKFCEDQQGRVWIGSDDGGLMCFLPKERRFTSYPHQDELSKRNVHALCLDRDGSLWIGTYTNGVQHINLKTGQMKQYVHTTDANSLDNSSSYAIFLDSKGRLWVGTMEGLNLYDREHDRFQRIGKTGEIIIDIDEDRQGDLWLSTQGCGLWRYVSKERKLRQYKATGEAGALPHLQVNCVWVDGSGQLWIGTFDGLCTYDAASDRFRRVRLDAPSQNVQSIIEDHGALWLATDRGVVKYVPGEGVQHFTLHDGLVSEQFQPNASMRATDGCIYFGTTKGFNSFYPYQMQTNTEIPPVYITTMSILNKEEQTYEGLPLDLSMTREIVLGYTDARMVSFSFASLSFCSPEKNQYAYMLEGFDREWNYVGNEHRATYTNIPAGTYVFRVKATNNDAVWCSNEAKLRIVVRPPFWWSWYAKLFYLLLLGGIIWQYLHYRLRKAERRHQRELQRVEETKEREVRDARLRFFTMIAHEIRTPVSLIMAPLEKMMRQGQPTDEMRIIDRNAHRLLELVNQLLDFRKVEQDMLVMHFEPHNIYQLIKAVSERFAPTFAQSGKRFSVSYPDEHFTAFVDGEGLTKVLSNLLTNANKYTKDEVSLRCEVEEGQHFFIEVADNGVGIRPEDRERIFEPFFQAGDNKPGTGIGLNIVKRIADLHHGTITVESEVGKGSTFKLRLPVTQPTDASAPTSREDKGEQALSDTHIPVAAVATEPIKQRRTKRPVMLIVEDSQDMQQFLSSHFSSQYEVVTAADGIEALEKLRHHQVDIIISDWMMPRMDGAAFCRHMRNDTLTSHIPFVMLTAKTDDDSKVTGMDCGADLYIEKPFSIQYLEACIRRTLDARKQLRELFSHQPLEPITQIASTPLDNDFLVRMNTIIEANFSNPELSVNFLAEQLGISRSGLFAKIKTLADLTPNEMIQVVRLKKAAQLLREGGRQVNEVCYMVGFNNPSYFSKCFFKQFGIRPGEMNGKQ